MYKSTALAALILLSFVLFATASTTNADAVGPVLQQSMIWLDSAPFGTEAYVAFRKEVQLGDRPKQATLHIFADTRYMLWINGQYVERGPCRFVPAHPEYDTIDVTSYLRQGDNAVAVLAHHYHDGVMQNDGSEVNGRVARHVPGLTAMLEIVGQGDSHERFLTDATWRASSHTRFGPSGVAPSSIPDHIDARLESGDWTVVGFNDSDWQSPVVIDGGQWGPLAARSIPMLCDTEVEPLVLIEQAGKPVSVPLAETLPIDLKPGDLLVIDANRYVMAYSILDFEAEAGSELELAYAQTYYESDRKPGLAGVAYGSSPHVCNYIAREGRQTYMSGDTFGCKYLAIRLKSGQLRLGNVRLVSRLYPFDVVGRFKSSDAMLNRLWQIGVNTMQLCSEDSYVDCAGRERCGWLGDAVVVSTPLTRVTLAGPGSKGGLLYADPRLARQRLWQMGHCTLPDGRVKAFAPSDGHDIHGYIEDYALLWIQGIRTHCDMTGEVDLADELWPAIEAQLQWFLDRLSPRGLVNAREFVFFGNPLAYEVWEGATLNAYLYRALLDAAELARLLNKPEQQQQYADLALSIKKAINSHLWDDEVGSYLGGLRDDQVARPTAYAAMMCLYFDVVPKERKGRVQQWLLKNYANEVLWPYAHAFLFETLYDMNTEQADQLVLDLMRSRWAEMVEGETQTAWEHFQRDERCHVMGGVPTYFLSRYVLGVGTDGPARDRRLVIEPRLGDLRRAEGTVVTEFGPVPVLWEKAADGVTLHFQVEIPDNVTAMLRLRQLDETRTVMLDGGVVEASRDAASPLLEVPLGPGKHCGELRTRSLERK